MNSNPLARPQFLWWARRGSWHQDCAIFWPGFALLVGFISNVLAFCLPMPTLMAFSFLILVSSSFFRRLIIRKKRGRDTFLLRTKLLQNHGVLPLSHVAPTGTWTGCSSGPPLPHPHNPHLWPPFQRSVPSSTASCPSFH